MNQVASVLKTDIQRTVGTRPWGLHLAGSSLEPRELREARKGLPETLRGMAAALLDFGFQSPKLSVNHCHFQPDKTFLHHSGST